MDFTKFYHPAALNSFQFIALTGVIMTLGAHLILHFGVHRELPGFDWLYVSWFTLYLFGTLRNLYGKPNSGHH